MTRPRRTTDLDVWKCADLGLRLAVFLGLGAYAGYRIDQWLDCLPLGIVTGSLAGLAAGMWVIIRTVSDLSSSRSSRSPRDDEERDRTPP